MAREDNPELDIHDIPAFLRHLLERVDWRRDLHFQTCTTIDTLDYSGSGLNEGSKLVIAAAGPPRRTLADGHRTPARAARGVGFRKPRLFCRASWRCEGPAYAQADEQRRATASWTVSARLSAARRDQRLSAGGGRRRQRVRRQSLNNFLWTTFTRSNPAADVYGIESFMRDKHWGCRGSLVIDARTQAAPCPAAWSKIPRRSASGSMPSPLPGRPLHGII